MLLVRFAILIIPALASFAGFDFSSSSPDSIDPGVLEGLYLYRGKLKQDRVYVSLNQLPKKTRVVKHGEMHTREIRSDRLTIFTNEKGKILKVGAFK